MSQTKGWDRTGRVEVPAVSVMDASGKCSRKLQPCPFTDTEASLSRLTPAARKRAQRRSEILQRILLATTDGQLFPARCMPGQTGDVVSLGGRR